MDLCPEAICNIHIILPIRKARFQLQITTIKRRMGQVEESHAQPCKEHAVVTDRRPFLSHGAQLLLRQS